MVFATNRTGSNFMAENCLDVVKSTLLVHGSRTWPPLHPPPPPPTCNLHEQLQGAAKKPQKKKKKGISVPHCCAPRSPPLEWSSTISIETVCVDAFLYGPHWKPYGERSSNHFPALPFQSSPHTHSVYKKCGFVLQFDFFCFVFLLDSPCYAKRYAGCNPTQSLTAPTAHPMATAASPAVPTTANGQASTTSCAIAAIAPRINAALVK